MKNLTIAFLAAASLFTVGACKKKGGAAEAVEKMGQLKDAMCKCTDKACAEKVQADYLAYGKTMEGKKEEKPDQAAIDKLMGLAGEYMKCYEKATGAGGEATPPAAGSAAPTEGSAAAAGGADLPQDCKDYQAAIEAFTKCEKVPAAARDAAKKSFEGASASWATATEEIKAQMGSVCKSAADGLKQSLSAAGC
jgi:hypothetical protein